MFDGVGATGDQRQGAEVRFGRAAGDVHGADQPAARIGDGRGGAVEQLVGAEEMLRPEDADRAPLVERAGHGRSADGDLGQIDAGTKRLADVVLLGQRSADRDGVAPAVGQQHRVTGPDDGFLEVGERPRAGLQQQLVALHQLAEPGAADLFELDGFALAPGGRQAARPRTVDGGVDEIAVLAPAVEIGTSCGDDALHGCRGGQGHRCLRCGADV